MKEKHSRCTSITIETVALHSGLSRYEVLRCMGRGLVRQPLTDGDMAELRRVRRLQDLGVNLAGIEIILRMRRRMLAMEAEFSQRDRARYPATRALVDDRWRRLLTWQPDEDRF